MNIEVKLYLPFVTAVNKLREKYGEEFEKLNGFHNHNLDFTEFINNFVDSDNVSNATIDANANASSKDVCSLMAEIDKPHTKLLSFNKIFYEITKKYGLATAQSWLEQEWSGGLYLHDAPSSSFKSYCFAYDLDELVERGLFFVNDFNSQAPKHLMTYVRDVLEFVSWTSNRTSGACGLPSFLIYSFYFWKHDVENNYYLKSPEYYRDQGFQEIIYGLNQPYLRVNQSAFTNFTIMDRPYLEEMFGGRVYPDGTYVIDYIDELIEYQKAFMLEVAKTRSETMFTFPVLTYSLLYKDGKFVDEEFARWCSDHNTLWCDSNFFISEDITSLSSCCFDGKQKVVTKTKHGVKIFEFKDLYEKYGELKTPISTLHNGSWVNAKVVKLPKRKMYKITTANKKEMIVTDNHIFPTFNGDKKVSEITVDDYLMVNTRKLNTFPEKNKGLTYEQGFLIGMYLGDGSKNNHGINLSLNENKYKTTLKIVNTAIEQIDETANFRLCKPHNNVYPTTIYGKSVKSFIEEWVYGDYSYEKDLNCDCLLQSVEFREGILDGYYVTDGGNSNRIYTTSENLINSMEILLTSIGKTSIIDLSDRTDEPVIIRGESFARNYPLYCIRWYNPMNKRSMSGVFKIKNNCEYFKIKEISEVEYDDESVYCFEMKNKDEPYFTLPNGIITHNCRLINDFSKLNGFINSIGGTALKIGSVKVNTINLVRLALESQSNEDLYIEELKNRVDICVKTLDVIRSIISRNIEKGLLPNYTYKLIELKNQYNTIGINGMYETMDLFGYIDTDKFGNKSYSDDAIRFSTRIMDSINEYKDSYQFDYSINVECVPAERCAVILYKKDNSLYGVDVENRNMYSNQWIPLVEKCKFDEKIRLGSLLDKKCGGGQISHINVKNGFTDKEQAWELLNKIAKEGVIYFAWNRLTHTCENGHGFMEETCPICGKEAVDSWTRVVGFLTPTKSYSKERKEEFSNRYWFDLED